MLDGAHTVNSVTFTLDTFEALYGINARTCILFGCAADKDVEHMAKAVKTRLAGFVDERGQKNIFLTRPGEVKSADLERMEKAFAAVNAGYTMIPDYREAISMALDYAGRNKLPLLVTGSFYLVAEVKKFLELQVG